MIFLYCKGRELWVAYADALRYHGFEVKMTYNFNDSIGNVNDIWIGQFYKFKEGFGTSVKMPSKFIPYVIDAVSDKQKNGCFKNLKRCDEMNGIIRNARMIFSYDKDTLNVICKNFGQADYKLFYMPFGYSPIYERYFPPNHEIEKDIDLLFYGNFTERRKEWINYLRNDGLNVVWCGEDKLHPPVVDKERSMYMSRAKIILNIYRSDPESAFNSMSRFSYIICNKCFLISEANKDSEVTNKLSEYIPMYETKEEMVNLCKFWLNQSKEVRNMICERNYNFLKSEMHLYEYIPVKELRALEKLRTN